MIATLTLEAFLRTYFGVEFPGFIPLFTRQTRKTRYFDAASVPALVSAAKLDALRHDVYVPIATQIAARAARSRGSAETTSAIFGFFADIDLATNKQSTKHYPEDEETALEILAGFSLRPTIVINSGNGLHVHWLLDQPLSIASNSDRLDAKAIWNGFQGQIQGHFRSHGYEIDSVGDLTRNFRLPETLNHRSNPPKPVFAIQFNPENRYPIDVVKPLTAPKWQPQKLAHREAPADHATISKECSWYGDVVVGGAADCDEPNWFAGASITSRCVDGERMFHQYSTKHPNAPSAANFRSPYATQPDRDRKLQGNRRHASYRPETDHAAVRPQ